MTESKLTEAEKAELRDWYDVGGRWNERISTLYRTVESIIDGRAPKRRTAPEIPTERRGY